MSDKQQFEFLIIGSGEAGKDLAGQWQRTAIAQL
jgi:hypothetical protein